MHCRKISSLSTYIIFVFLSRKAGKKLLFLLINQQTPGEMLVTLIDLDKTLQAREETKRERLFRNIESAANIFRFERSV